MEKQQLIREAKNLSLHLRESREYQAYTAARETAFANDTTKALIEQYHRLQLKAQGDMLSCGKAEDKTMEELKKLGELLQFNPAAAGFLMAEYGMNQLLSEVYQALGQGLDMSLPAMPQEEGQA